MSINNNLLVAAPMLQDYLVDKTTGAPLSSGIITLWVDTSRYTTYKNWYYQTGTPGAYDYVTLDNPLTLSAVGTIQDPNGNDVIPFYYPFDEDNENLSQAYFVTVYSADENGDPATLQFTRENFPFQPENNSVSVTSPTLRNYIINNVYWRNSGSASLNSVLDTVIAPSQHDGYTNGDIRFIKNTAGATDSLEFSAITTELDNNQATPEYALHLECSGATTGETVKCIQYPISLHLNTLANVNATVVFYAQNVSGSANNFLDVEIYQYTGTGAASASVSVPFGSDNGHIVLTSTMDRYTLNDYLPSTTGLTLGTGGDDAMFLRIKYPTDAVFNIKHTKPQIYLSTEISDNDFDTYDQISTVTDAPRTGDVRMSLNAFQPYGWLLCNDGVISNAPTSPATITPPAGIPTARQNIDCWPLFNLLWTNTNVAMSPIFDSAGASSSKTTAIADWTANKQIQLSLTLGRTLLGLPPVASVTYDRATTPGWGSVAGVFTATSNTLLYPGAPIYLTGTMPAGGNFVASTIYYAIPPIDASSTVTFQLASSYANALAGTAIAAGGASNNGTSLVVNFALGGSFGQSRHVQLSAELAAHTHPPLTGTGYLNPAGTPTTGNLGAGTDQGVNATTGSTGSSHPFNIVQPSVYYNVFLKL